MNRSGKRRRQSYITYGNKTWKLKNKNMQNKTIEIKFWKKNIEKQEKTT